MWFNKKKKNTEEIVDEELIKRIEPRGGITFKKRKTYFDRKCLYCMY